ncbi:MAG: glycosyltransferase [Zoogloeaceae bacterium]|nr:glycosyltransferase [Zoogloeaceae bacterium]
MMGSKVLQICHGYSGPFLDVASQYTDALTRCGYEVHTVYLTGAPSEEVERQTGGAVVHFFNRDSRDISGLKIGVIRRIKALVAKDRYVLCVTHRFKPTFIACLATRLPVMAVFHAFGVFQRRSRRLLACLFRKRLLILGVSDAVRDDIRSALGSTRAVVETFHNRIDIDAARAQLLGRAQARKALAIAEDAFVFGNVGRLHPDKDQECLLRAFAAARNNLPAGSCLVVVGSGRLKSRLHTLAQDLGLSEDDVFWIDYLPNARRYFRAFDAFVLSSDHEPFGMVVLEAMLAEVPIVATRAGGVPEILGQDYPLLFPVADAPRLQGALLRVAGMRGEERAELVAEMERRLKTRFSFDVAANRMAELIDLLRPLRRDA